MEFNATWRVPHRALAYIHLIKDPTLPTMSIFISCGLNEIKGKVEKKLNFLCLHPCAFVLMQTTVWCSGVCVLSLMGTLMETLVCGVLNRLQDPIPLAHKSTSWSSQQIMGQHNGSSSKDQALTTVFVCPQLPQSCFNGLAWYHLKMQWAEDLLHGSCF
jgi:hypothetical protein